MATPLRVLFVDDEMLRLQPFADELQDRGFVVTRITDASEAIAQAAADPDSIDVIVMDLMMSPGKDAPANLDWRRSGLWALRRIREIPKLRTIPVVILSGVTRRNVAEELETYGLGDLPYLEKPVDLDSFVHTVQNCVREGGGKR